jgi:SPP1 gp7 family putative phage head morphogenesis protein
MVLAAERNPKLAITNIVDNVREELESRLQQFIKFARREYIENMESVRARIGDLEDELEGIVGEDQVVTQEAIESSSVYNRIIGELLDNGDDYAKIIKEAIIEFGDDAVLIGANIAEELALVSAGEGAEVLFDVWSRPDPEVVLRAIRYVDHPEFRAIFDRFGQDVADGATDLIKRMVARGANPRKIARALEAYWLLPYSWVENTTRTLQLWSYRTATHVAYALNDRVVRGWMWWAVLDNRTCPLCWSMHGQIFTNDQILNEHHRGRCTPVPIVVGSRWADTVETGREIFARLPTGQQQEIMGGSLWEAWSSGQVSWDDIVSPYQHAVFGEMLTTATLGQALANAAER